MRIAFTLNGRAAAADADPRAPLLGVLRGPARCTGAKEGCGAGECGTCTVLLDGRAVNACLVPAGQAAGRDVVTVEGLADPAAPHPLLASFAEEGAVQCGFCTPGMIVAAKALLDRNPRPSEAEIRAGLSGNLCRCTGYQPVVDAVRRAARRMARAGDRIGSLPVPPPPGPSVSSPAFVEPDSIGALWDALERPGGVRFVAGGTDLMPAARAGAVPADARWISLARLPAFDTVVVVGERLRVGALCTADALASDPLVRGHAAALAQAAAAMAAPAVRNRATLGGNLATASPAGDLLPPLVVLEAELRLLSPTGERVLPVSEFLTGPKTTALCEGEIVAWIEIPLVHGRRSGFARIGPRSAMAVSKASAAVAVQGEGAWQGARVALGAVAPTVIRSPSAEAALEGARLVPEALAAAGAGAALDARPLDDHRSTADYRRAVLPVLLERALDRAAGDGSSRNKRR